MWYKLDFRRLSVQLIPTFLRSPRMVAWVNALVSPLEQVQDEFNANRRDNLTRLNHNSQVCYLRKILNDSFDSQSRRIQVLPANNLKQTYIYTRPEYKVKYLKVFARERSEYGDGGVDFIIQIPGELNFYRESIAATADYYRLAAKRFSIIVNDVNPLKSEHDQILENDKV